MITLIDYGLGNLQAFFNVYKRLHIPVQVANTVKHLESATKLILPGVGSFDHAMQQFTQSGMQSEVEKLVTDREMPILGICVGMQMLADSSDEGDLDGLGWISGQVKAFKGVVEQPDLPFPHMGWNNVQPVPQTKLFNGLEADARFYFLHSYFYDVKNEADCIASATYGDQFCCAVAHKNIFGVQFHPEKSHHFGVQLLNNFAVL